MAGLQVGNLYLYYICLEQRRGKAGLEASSLPRPLRLNLVKWAAVICRSHVTKVIQRTSMELY